MGKILCISGIILVMAGTILSLWSVLSTKTKYYGTAECHDNQQKEFKKQKNMVIIGIILIVLGSILQVIGTLI